MEDERLARGRAAACLCARDRDRTVRAIAGQMRAFGGVLGRRAGAVARPTTGAWTGDVNRDKFR